GAERAHELKIHFRILEADNAGCGSFDARHRRFSFLEGIVLDLAITDPSYAGLTRVSSLKTKSFREDGLPGQARQ
ncbi:MAG: hypothetical protein WBX07_16620, partial [Rhodoplanes sp.]